MTMTTPDKVNADFTRPATQAVDDIDWIPTPEPGVLRKPLDRVGAEVARATSIVRFDGGKSFPAHGHPLGEEILVLSGIFSDESGDFGPGAYVRNPPGSSHTPHSREGCEIFVKLRQMREEGEPRVVLDTDSASWQQIAEGYQRIPLFDADDGSEFVALEQLAAGAETTERKLDGGEEILLLEGDLTVDGQRHGALSWIRQPAGATYALSSSGGARFWVKRGHLNV